MRVHPGLRLPLQVLLCGAANSIVGAAIGLAVSVFTSDGFEPTIILISVLFGNVVGFTVLIATATVSPRLRSLGPWARGFLQVLTLLSGSVAGTALVLYLFPLFVLRDLRMALAVLTINGLLALIVGAIVSFYEHLRDRLAESLREVEEVRLVEARLKEHAARAELAALQARINPHFFFNTLNTISSLLAEDPDGADDVIQKLAGLFRYTFRASDARPVPLSEEIGFVKDYLEIERARFGERLRIEITVEPAAARVPVPGLILQPLIENAIGHGISPLTGGGTVRVTARISEGNLVVEVSDDGVGLPRDREGFIRSGHGLANVEARLKTLYRRAGSLTLHPAEGGRGALARLRLPAPSPEDDEGVGVPAARARLAGGQD